MSKALDMARELVKKLEEEEKQSKAALSTLNPGEIFKIGEYAVCGTSMQKVIIPRCIRVSTISERLYFLPERKQKLS